MPGQAGTEQLGRFRERLHGCFVRRADALFELSDAVLTTGSVSSPVHLSLSPVHRRGWGSLYAALSKGCSDFEALRDLLAQYPLADSGSDGVPETTSQTSQVYAVDQSAWPRCDAEASPGRGYYYHPSRHSAGQPIAAGWSYQLVAELDFERDSWIAPMDMRRVPPEQDANDVAAEQVKALVSRLSRLDVGCVEPPLFVFDAGYDPVRLQQGLENCRAQLLVRLHSTRAFYADPPQLERRPVGRPFVHGEKFDLKDPSSLWSSLYSPGLKSKLSGRAGYLPAVHANWSTRSRSRLCKNPHSYAQATICYKLRLRVARRLAPKPTVLSLLKGQIFTCAA